MVATLSYYARNKEKVKLAELCSTKPLELPPYPGWRYRQRAHERGEECFCRTCRAAANKRRRNDDSLHRAARPLRCDVCGRYVRADGSDGATRRMVSCDSHYSSEDYETLCADCGKRPSVVFSDRPNEEKTL